MRSKASASSAGPDSVLPATRSYRLRRMQDRIVSSNERIEPVCLRSGPLDPLLLLRREFSVVARSVLDRDDEMAHAGRALQATGVG